MVAVSIGGLGGGLADSVLGRLLQATRRCEACGRVTERAVHDCGTPTLHARGLRWMTNDTVNLLATESGALGALAASRLSF